MKIEKVRIAVDDNESYKKLGIKKNKVSYKEDGMRTSGDKGTYEWWYVDAEFEDGTTVVNIFWTKDGFDVSGAAHPRADLDITFANGEKISKKIYGEKGKVIDAKKDVCNIYIGGSSLRYIDGKYHLDYESDDVKYHVVMEGLFPMWRQNSGFNFYGEDDSKFGAWLVPQPASVVTGTLEVKGKVKKLKGTGYHDHNWGNIPTNKVLDHWYWGRAKIGDYNIIACDIVLSKKYGSLRMPRIMIAKDGKIIEDNQAATIIQRKKTHYHPVTKKFMDDVLIYTQPVSDRESYVITFERQKDIMVKNLLDQFSKSMRFFGKIAGANPTYVRILGKVTLEHIVDGKSEIVEDTGLWEQMSLGKSKVAIINEG